MLILHLVSICQPNNKIEEVWHHLVIAVASRHTNTIESNTNMLHEAKSVYRLVPYQCKRYTLELCVSEIGHFS